MEQVGQPSPGTQAAQPVDQATDSLFKKLPVKNVMKKNVMKIAAAVVVVLAGVGTGWLLSGRVSGSGSMASRGAAPGAQKGADEAGIADESTFRDTAEGKLESGGIDGEGTHHLVRDGGSAQNVYLTSTVVDLESFVGKKVQVWGETITAQKAGWLMDVGKIRVVN